MDKWSCTIFKNYIMNMSVLTRDGLHPYELECVVLLKSFENKKPYLFEKSQVYVYSSVPGTVDKTGVEETFGLILFLSAVTRWEG